MYRKHRPSLPRLVLRRGPQPHPHRIRPGKHHPPATLRHPTHQGAWTQCRRDTATTEQKCPLRLRLPQNDGKHTAKTPPLNPSLPSTGRPNQTAGSSPGPVPPELSATPADNPNPAVHPGINTRAPSTNLPCPTGPFYCPARRGAGVFSDPLRGAFRCLRAGSGLMEVPPTPRPATPHQSLALDHDKKWACPVPSDMLTNAATRA